MVDWPLFVLGLVAVSIVVIAVRAVSREDLAARTAAAARTRVVTPPAAGRK